jgi:hypothetical protein
MADRATPNLPVRAFAETAAFYTTLGCDEDYPDGTLLRLIQND